MSGKGSTRRPSRISREEENLRWMLATGRIKFAQYEKRMRELRKLGLVWRK
jgi:uncharacterized membrane protein